MSRLESTAQAGYFPTPPRIVAAIVRHLTPPASSGKRGVRLLDPCAGTGVAAESIARSLRAESYGIEINEDRAHEAVTRLDQVLTTSAFAVRLANGAFSLLFLNPPYADDEEHHRLERAFLTSMSRALGPGGILVFVIPQRRLATSARYLASHYTTFRVFRFPDPEYAAFRQIVLFAALKPRPTLDLSVQARLDAWSVVDLPPLPDAPEYLPPLLVPGLPAGEVLFASLSFDPAQAAAEAWRRGVWVQPRLAEQLWPPDERPTRPLMPLRRGHLALLTAAGMLDNVVLDQEGQRLLVKGRVHKELVPVESDDNDVEISREVLRTSVMVLDLTTGALEVVEQSTGLSSESTRRAA